MSRVIAAFLIMVGLSSVGSGIQSGLRQVAEAEMRINGYERVQIGPWYDFNHQWIKVTRPTDKETP